MKKINEKIAMIVSLLAMLVIVFGTSSCKKSSDNSTTPSVIVLDGYYVTGSVTPYADFNDKAMMKLTPNEPTQDTTRTSLLELYIPLKAGAAGFSIVQVAGSKRNTYGPLTGFGVVTKLLTDEPTLAPFQRGPVSTTSATKFTVPEDGMYHVVIDYALNMVIIARVHWGLIGAATTLGWGSSTAMTESAFNQTTMSWTISNLTLTGGEWKFRYSGGWKIVLDTTTDDGGGKLGVKVNTNFGGAVNKLVPGGGNIVNTVPGIYTLTLSYTMGSGYTATANKTGDLPLTNWTGVRCDAVGAGVDSTNATATKDTSSWKWGYQMLADNAGVPSKVGNVYTWTWTNITLKATSGFKVRTVNGVAPPVGGANFDAGFSALNVGASSNLIVDDGGGNLSTTTRGSFTITLNIDAGNSDKKEIIIVKL